MFLTDNVENFSNLERFKVGEILYTTEWTGTWDEIPPGCTVKVVSHFPNSTYLCEIIEIDEDVLYDDYAECGDYEEWEIEDIVYNKVEDLTNSRKVFDHDILQPDNPFIFETNHQLTKIERIPTQYTHWLVMKKSNLLTDTTNKTLNDGKLSKLLKRRRRGTKKVSLRF